MKKILTWMTVLCMLLSFAALAEEPALIDPFADPAEQTETAPEAEAPVEAEPEPTATAVNYAVPAGQELYQFDSGNAPEWGLISVGEVNYDVLQARDADEAENTLRITARPGQRLIAVRMYFHPFVSGMTYDQAFDAKMQLGKDLYACRKYVETITSGVATVSSTAATNTKMEKNFCYLLNADGLSNTMKVEDAGYNAYYYMFDVYTLVPEEALANGEPVFLILTLGEKQFYCQVM